MSDELLDDRALNRALLARQWLLTRKRASVERALAQLVGMQAQAPLAPYVGLWSRLAGFRTAALADALVDRRAVRLAMMRSTVHLVTADDAIALRPVLAASLAHAFDHASPFARRIAGVDRAAVIAHARALLDEQPRTLAELGPLLAVRWPGRDPEALAQVVRSLAPLVQVPPRGVWGAGGQAVCATLEHWLGRPLSADAGPDALVMRYLGAFGPASVADAQTWSGVRRLGEVFARLPLRAFRDARGHTLYDVADAPRPRADTVAPPRFLPEYDNLLLAHADRTRVHAAADRARITHGSLIRPVLLIDGFVAATWRLEQRGARAELAIAPFRRLSRVERAEVIAEGERLLGFAAAGARDRDLVIAAPPR